MICFALAHRLLMRWVAVERRSPTSLVDSPFGGSQVTGSRSPTSTRSNWNSRPAAPRGPRFPATTCA